MRRPGGKSGGGRDHHSGGGDHHHRGGTSGGHHASGSSVFANMFGAGGGGGGGAGAGGGGAGLVKSSTILAAAAAERKDNDALANSMISGGSAASGGLDIPLMGSESFDVVEMDLSVLASSSSMSGSIVRERRVDLIPSIALLRTSVKQAEGAGAASGPIVKAVSATDEPRVTLYLDSGWFHFTNHQASASLMLVLPRKHQVKHFAASIEKHLSPLRILFAPRMSGGVQLPIGMNFPSFPVIIGEHGEIRQTVLLHDESGASQENVAEGEKGEKGEGGEGGNNNQQGNNNNNNPAADLSLIRDLELRKLLEATEASPADMESLLHFGVTPLAPAVVEAASALLAAAQSSNPVSHTVSKLAETISATLTTHEIQGRLHLAIPVCRSAVLCFAALIQLARYSPLVCLHAGDGVVDALDRCVGALLQGGFECCLGLPENAMISQELAQHMVVAILLLEKSAGITSIVQQQQNKHVAGDEFYSSSSSSSSSSSASSSSSSAITSSSNTMLLFPMISRALLLTMSLVTPLPIMNQKIIEILADSHSSNIILATHSTSTVFAEKGGSSASSSSSSSSKHRNTSIDAYVSLRCSIALAFLGNSVLNHWAARITASASSSSSSSSLAHATLSDLFSSSSSSTSAAANASSSSSSSSSAGGAGDGGKEFSNFSTQIVLRSSASLLSLSTVLLENSMTERCLAAISSRSVVNKENAAVAATALLSSQQWADDSKESMMRIFGLTTRLSEAVMYTSTFFGGAILHGATSAGTENKMCWDQATVALSTPLRRSAAWFGTIFPVESAEKSSTASSASSSASFLAASRKDEASSSSTMSQHSTHSLQRAMKESMTRAACRYLAARASVDGLTSTLTSVAATAGSVFDPTSSSSSSSSSSTAAAASAAAAAAAHAIGVGEYQPGAIWLVRLTVLCGAASLRTEVIGAAAVLLRLQALSAANASQTRKILLRSRQRMKKSYQNSYSSSSSSMSSILNHLSDINTNESHVAAASAAGVEGMNKNTFEEDNNTLMINEARAAATAVSLDLQRVERVWSKWSNQLHATLQSCPQPSTAHSVWSTASLIIHRFSQAAILILQKTGSISSSSSSKMATPRSSPLLFSTSSSSSSSSSSGENKNNSSSSPALICATLVLSVPQSEALLTFSGGGDYDEDDASAVPNRPPDAAHYLSSDAWDGLAEFENDRPGVSHALAESFHLSGHHDEDDDDEDEGNKKKSQEGEQSPNRKRHQHHFDPYRKRNTEKSSSSTLSLTPSVQEEAFWYIGESCRDENESVRLMTASRRRLQAVQDARESAAAPPSRCAWFAAKAIRDFARAFFRASQDLFDDQDTMALVCSELSNLFFFGSGVQHASLALMPVLTCIRQTHDVQEAALASGNWGAPPPAAETVSSNNTSASSSSSSRYQPVRATAGGGGGRNNQHQQNQQQNQPLKRESVLVATLRSQRMLNQQQQIGF